MLQNALLTCHGLCTHAFTAAGVSYRRPAKDGTLSRAEAHGGPVFPEELLAVHGYRESLLFSSVV